MIGHLSLVGSWSFQIEEEFQGCVHESNDDVYSMKTTSSRLGNLFLNQHIFINSLDEARINNALLADVHT